MTNSRDWQELLELTQGKEFEIERVRLKVSGIAIEGAFKVPPLAQLSPNDMLFVESFVTSHGSIKSMEKEFDLSYPSIKNKLNRLTQLFRSFAKPEISPSDRPSQDRETLESLMAGQLDIDTALKLLKKS